MWNWESKKLRFRVQRFEIENDWRFLNSLERIIMHILEDHMPSLSFSTNGENVNCHENYCMHIIIIIVIKLFLVQFWNKRALVNCSKIVSLWKTWSCSFIPNYTRNNEITRLVLKYWRPLCTHADRIDQQKNPLRSQSCLIRRCQHMKRRSL